MGPLVAPPKNNSPDKNSAGSHELLSIHAVTPFRITNYKFVIYS
jgi:hypothetical protein